MVVCFCFSLCVCVCLCVCVFVCVLVTLKTSNMRLRGVCKYNWGDGVGRCLLDMFAQYLCKEYLAKTS